MTLSVSCAENETSNNPPIDEEYYAPPVKQELFNTSRGDGVMPPYRIPGITVTQNGTLIATAARLVCGTDPGYGRNDIVCRRSYDNGASWSDIEDVAVGTGITSATENFFDTAFGDPAIVADRTSDEVLVMAVAGCTVYGNSNTTRQNPQLIAAIRSMDGGYTWLPPTDVTENIYTLFDGKKPLAAAFVSGGNIFQSRVIKSGDYFRIYIALCARPNGNRVLYSDDFGRTWSVLGGAMCYPIPDGDEAKCEELPNGDVVLSSRMSGGRLYNIFTYSDTTTAQGSWDKPKVTTFVGSGHAMGRNATNGDILIIPVIRNSDGCRSHLLLQSIPTGDNRSQLGIYYKEFVDSGELRTAQDFVIGWDGFFLVSETDSAYSSMILQANKRIALIYEETLTGFGKRPNPISTCFPNGEGTHNFDGFDNIYVSYTIDHITDGAYSIAR